MRIATVLLQSACLAGLCGLTTLWASDAAQPPAEKQTTHEEKASVIRGMHVKNAKGEVLGRIEDLAITCKGGHVLYAVLDYGGTLGFGQKHLAVPPSALKREGNKDASHPGYLVMDISETDLNKLPGFNENDWPTAPDAYFKVAAVENGPNRTHFRRSRYLIGMAARNPKGESVGTIRDLVINHEQARVVYADLGHSKGAFSAEKQFAVPWQALDLRSLTGRPADECFVIDIDNSTLDNNPGFNRDNWPTVGDTSLFKSIRNK